MLSRDELLTLPEFVLLSLFPNGLLPEGQMNSYDGDVYQVDVSVPSSFRSDPISTVSKCVTRPAACASIVSQAKISPVQLLLNIKGLLSNNEVYLSDLCFHSQYDPESLQFMLDFFRSVAQTIPQQQNEGSSAEAP